MTWEADTFAYAQGKDEESGRYSALDAGKSVNIQSEGGRILVKPDVAARQIREEAAHQKSSAASGGGTISPSQPGETVFPSNTGTQDTQKSEDSDVPPVTPVYRRFYGSVKLDSLLVSRDAGRIADEVIQHLTKLVGANVEVTLEIQAQLSEGASEKTVRDVTENCRTLRFDSFGFEEE